MPHRSGCAGQHPVTGEAREARAPAGDRTTPGRGQAPGWPPGAQLKNRAHVTCRGTSEWCLSSR